MKELFTQKVYSVVKRIPKGSVLTCKEVARVQEIRMRLEQ
jgi:alkylated DNA nucleotide flippase Atl1